MTTSVSIQHSTWSVELERHEFIFNRRFDDALAAINEGLGHPHFAKFMKRIGAIEDWDGYRAAVTEEAGPAGLILFMELDMGSVIERDPEATGFHAVRIIAGNPVTMESMTRTTPAAGAFAPVTILLFEAKDGVHIRYDTLASAVGAEMTQAASIVARKLDLAVLQLIEAALKESLPPL